jgi:imidazolonepropionase-like amidohydrolase
MSRATSARYALLPDQVWDGRADTVASGMAVIVEGNRISDVLPAAQLSAGVAKSRLPGCTLIPGLIDAHVHYVESAGPAYLAAGVTTVRDVGNDLDWILGQRERNKGSSLKGPRILCCGRLLDGNEGIWQYVVKRHTDEKSLRASIRENVTRGVDQIKLYASVDAKLLKAGVEEAHSLGKFILAHLNSTSAEDAADAGLDEIEHFSRCDVGWRTATTEEDDRLIERFLRHGTIMDPTLVVWDRLGRAMDHGFQHDERLRWVHPFLRDIWERFPYRNTEPANRLRFQALMPNLKRFYLRCHQRGVVIAAGTDTPFINLIPGFSLHDELAQAVDTGLRPVDALRAATATNAKVLGLGDEIGGLRRGMQADLVAVTGNPLRRIDDVANIAMVVKQGVRVDIEEMFKAAKRAFKKPMTDPMILDLADYASRPMPTYRQKTGNE